MKQPTPRELMQASIACVVLASAALHWNPELSAELLLLTTALAGFAVLPAKERLVELLVNGPRVSSEGVAAKWYAGERSVNGGNVHGRIFSAPQTGLIAPA